MIFRWYLGKRMLVPWTAYTVTVGPLLSAGGQATGWDQVGLYGTAGIAAAAYTAAVVLIRKYYDLQEPETCPYC